MNNKGVTDLLRGRRARERKRVCLPSANGLHAATALLVEGSRGRAWLVLCKKAAMSL